MSFTESDRKQKLQHGLQKLKQYREQRGRNDGNAQPISHVRTSGSDDESIPESSISLPASYAKKAHRPTTDDISAETTTDDAVERSRSALNTAPSKSPSTFFHDERRSAFRRVKAPDPASGPTSSHIGSEFHSQAGNGSIQFGDDAFSVPYESVITFDENPQPSLLTAGPTIFTDSSETKSSVFCLLPQQARSDTFGAQQQQETDGIPQAQPLVGVEPIAEFRELPPIDATPDNALRQQLFEQHAYCDQLKAQYESVQKHYTALYEAYMKLSAEVSQQTDHAKHDVVTRLESDIQRHLHTMSVLVEEKGELQSQLRQLIDTVSTKHSENEDLRSRLQASRLRTSTLERHLETASTTSREVDTVQHQLQIVTQERDALLVERSDAVHESRELSSKLRTKTSECEQLRTRVDELQRRVDMSEIYVAQIGQIGSDDAQRRAEVTELHRVREEYSQLYTEAAAARVHYESYARRMNEEVGVLRNALEVASVEKAELQGRLTASVEELDAVKDRLKTGVCIDRDEILKLRQHFDQQIDTERQRQEAIRVECQQQLRAKDDELVVVQENALVLETEIRRLQNELKEAGDRQQDTSTVVQALQNERATVSRAVAQNAELKAQLSELQDRFVKVTNDTMEMASKLQSVEHALEGEKACVAKKEEEVVNERKQHRSEVEILRDQNTLLQRAQLDRSKLEDRVQHFDGVSSELQSELARTKSALTSATEENSRLKVLLAEQHRERNDEETPSVAPSRAEADLEAKSVLLEERNGENERLKAKVDELRVALKERETTSNQYRRENEELHRIMEQNSEDENQNSIHFELQNALDRINALSNENHNLQRMLREQEQARNGAVDSSTTNGSGRESADIVGVSAQRQEHENGVKSLSRAGNHTGDDSSICSEHEQQNEAMNSEALEKVKNAMELLQDRFRKAMNENADLTEHNQHLEHLIVQLQGETDTVGEYITLYQHQRRQIRERMKEREEYIAKLSHENEQMKTKLHEVQKLVMRLLGERGSLRPYQQAVAPVRGRALPQVSSLPPRSPRKLSETIVDETLEVSAEPDEMASRANGEGAEATGRHRNKQAKKREGVPRTHGGPSSVASSSVSDLEEAARNSIDDGAGDYVEQIDVGSRESAIDGADDAVASRILSLLSEIQTTTENRGVVDRQLHCKYCRGQLQVL